MTAFPAALSPPGSMPKHFAFVPAAPSSCEAPATHPGERAGLGQTLAGTATLAESAGKEKRHGLVDGPPLESVQTRRFSFPC